MSPTISMKLCMRQEKKILRIFSCWHFFEKTVLNGFFGTFLLKFSAFCALFVSNVNKNECAQNWTILYVNTQHSYAISFSCRGTSLRLSRVSYDRMKKYKWVPKKRVRKFFLKLCFRTKMWIIFFHMTKKSTKKSTKTSTRKSTKKKDNFFLKKKQFFGIFFSPYRT